ncbi:hypothetical protein D9M71_278820 [compost metagenome]
MASSIIYDYGSAVNVVVPAGESIVVYTLDQAQVFQLGLYPNQPPTRSLLGTVVNTTTTFGPFTTAATLTVVGGAGETLFAVGVAPAILETKQSQIQGNPVAVDVTGAISSAAIQGGIVTSTTGAAVAGTLPAGSVLDLAAQMSIGDSFDWSVINTGGNTFTVTAATGHTIVGVAAVVTVTSGNFRTRKTAADTFITYRMS